MHRTDSTTRALIEAAIHDLSGTLDRAYREWLDDGRPRNVERWRARIERRLPQGWRLVKMTARPFGFRFTIGNGAVYAIACTARIYRWERISP